MTSRHQCSYASMMRTTLTLDDDVAARLDHVRARDGRPFRQLVNDVLRAGLDHAEARSALPRGPYTRPVDLGRPRLPDVDDVSEALALLDADGLR